MSYDRSNVLMRFLELEQVMRLSPPQARGLLREGDGQERIWAAWVLAAREGAAFVSELRQAWIDEDDAGVRRHWLVVLAGYGCRDLVAETAARDSDPAVRSTATRYLAQLAEPDDAASYDLLLSRAIDISWLVRQTVAGATRSDAPSHIFERLVGLLFDPDPYVRDMMRCRIERGDFPREPVAAALEILERVVSASTVDDDGPGSGTRALVKYRPPLRPV